ncbi:hypothetical protein ANOM_009865 [Aspergillus nomiae NRRL 13137]|uniref:Uncharacterized protein n=1 Tax=Aspergillus nomiae NRRL (strain ATCC 15546 / NRRL 13137 / CBS 260.88 / M93) TaxID=1509407 RepID=A0A0L1IRL6_ASPN3|nr:uncharacterized protein ANOM_009865 [Aspergillus nomiae NRRL 13137]KNG82127.1 hypothetical protein ANOM_009865 [Aspergillus nomiae NRRL 13137]
MSEIGFRVASRRIPAEKSAKHIGVARIKLNMLEFPNSRSLDPKNVQRPKKLFRGPRGCKPGDLQNRIPAVVDEATLGEALNASGLTRDALLSPGPDYPRLDLPPGNSRRPALATGKPEVFTVASVRERFSARLVANSVPSLSGFFDDLKHLKLVADSVKWLVRLERRETIRSALEYSFSDADYGNNLCLVQTSSSSFRSVSGSDIDWFDVAYRVLWLYALREYLEMPAEPKKKLTGPRNGQVNEKVLFEFASLAHKLGFRSVRIQDLLQRGPDREIDRRLLLTARKSDRFRYHDLERCVTGVTELMKSAQAIRDGDDTDAGEDQVRSPNRSGIPNRPDQARHKPYVFLDKLHADVACGPTLTSLFIQRSTYFAFLGKQISVDAVDVNSRHEEQATTDPPRPGPEPSAGGHPRPELMIVDEDPQQNRLENLRRTADEQEARLEQLTQRERGQQENIAQLQNAVSEQEERLMASSRDAEALQEKLDDMRRAEAEQVIKLESLEVDEEKRRTIIGTLEQTQHELGEEIRLDLLAAGQREQALRDDEAQTARLKQLSEEEQENQRNLDQFRAQTARQQDVLDQLAATERERKATLEQREAEERRKYTVVAELSENARQLSDEEKIQAESWARIENEHKSVGDKLVARELELRGNIDQLAACLERLQAKIEKATNASIAAQNVWQQGVLAIHCASVCTAAQRMPGTDIEFISVVALLAPVVLAAPQARQERGWIALLQEQCPDMPKQCLDIAKKVHEPAFGIAEVPQATQAMPTCTPAYVDCTKAIAGESYVSTFPEPGGTQLATCLLQIAPDHFKYFLDNDSAEIPIPAPQNCALRELHRVAHVELGPLA